MTDPKTIHSKKRGATVARNNLLYVSLVASLLVAIFLTPTSPKKQLAVNDLDVELKRCEKLSSEGEQIACLEKLMTTSKKELAKIEDLEGALEFQNMGTLNSEGLLSVKAHFEKAAQLDPENENYRENLEIINELIEDKF